VRRVTHLELAMTRHLNEVHVAIAHLIMKHEIHRLVIFCLFFERVQEGSYRHAKWLAMTHVEQ
jgi:hypothetical protein